MKTMIKIFLPVICIGLMSGCNHKPVKTIENLKTAYNGETTASAKYAAFAEKAREEGFDTVAVMFFAASKSEYIHAASHLYALATLGEKAYVAVIDTFNVLSTMENLTDGIKGETYESKKMYPGFISAAEKEKSADGITTLTRAFNTEKKHKEFFETALTALKGGGEMNLPAQWFVCPVCGNTYDNTYVTGACDQCKTTPDNFIVFSL
jgi:rubrerythrin